jgi:hypothetical protein
MRGLQYDRYNAGDELRLFADNSPGHAYRGECDRLVERALALAGAPHGR